MSKTNQLGVIVLAVGILAKTIGRKLRLVCAVAAALGVSRKAGYAAARRIECALEAAEAPTAERKAHDRRELLLLQIRIQVVTYERDHRRVRFAKRRRHLSAGAKSLCVRLLREFRSELPEPLIARTIGVSYSSLRRWDRAALDDGSFPQKPDDRGKHRHYTPEDEERVIAAFNGLAESLTLEAFALHYRAIHPDRPLDRRTITRILQKNKLAPIRVKPDDSTPYHDKVEVHFPGAQVSIDAVRTAINFDSPPAQRILVTREVAIDIATSAVVGDVMRREEDAEGVERVIVSARKECRNLLALLADNGTANRSARVRQVVEENLEVGTAFSFPYHPRTNGHIEGFFGRFSQIVGAVTIDDSSRERLAESIADLLWRVFVHCHNHSPRKSLDGNSPVEYLNRYSVQPDEVERAKKALSKRRERSDELRRPHARLSDPKFRQLVGQVISEHSFQVDLDDALRALLPYDQKVITRSSAAFAISSARDGFDKRKRTFAYFTGIVRNKQEEVKRSEIRTRFEHDKAEQYRREEEAHSRRLREEAKREAQALREHPEEVILDASRTLLLGRLRYMRETSLARLRAALESLVRRGRASRDLADSLALTIRGWPEHSEELKDAMIDLLREEFAAACGSPAPT